MEESIQENEFPDIKAFMSLFWHLSQLSVKKIKD